MGTVWDAPNKQVLGLDPPWVEGTGGSGAAPKSDENPLDAMTKEQLLEYAADHGVEADASMTKAEIRAAIDAAQA